MVKFEKFTADNGLKVIIHEDRTTPLVAMNIMYRAGSKYEDPELTGIAHLMEHLMFSGSVSIPDFDTPLQLAGGENNAFTNNDVASFYITIPADNIETAFWLESDRMLNPAFSEDSLEVQKKVVSEEFRQRYLNQPYGDAMLLLRPEAYLVHPYRWPTIGKEVSHIEKTTLNDVKEYFRRHYSPDNAVMCLAGNITTDRVSELCDKWFSPIPSVHYIHNPLPIEPAQLKHRTLSVERNVPSDMIYKAWHVCGRNDTDFRILDLLSDLMSGGESGLLYEKLVREKKMFSELNAYLTGDADPGLLVCYGKLMQGVDILKAEEEIDHIVNGFRKNPADGRDIEKVKNRFESTSLMSNLNVLNKAMNLCSFELMGDASLINEEVGSYRRVTAEQAAEAANKYLTEENSTTLYYKAIHK